MAYVTAADVEERLGEQAYIELTDDTGSGTADVDKVNEAIAGAEGEVDSHLGRRYAVPVELTGFPTIAAVLKSVVLDLVEYRLRSRRPPVPDEYRRKRGDAAAWLERVAAGEVVLPGPTPVAETEALGLLGRAVGTKRELSRDELKSL
jgi:phage gp36-like protein